MAFGAILTFLSLYRNFVFINLFFLAVFMNIGLMNHERRYHLTFSEIALSSFTLTAVPFALRHLELAQQSRILCPSENRDFWLQRTIAFFEYLPLIGGIVGLAEWSCFLVSSSFKQLFPLVIKKEKMKKNGRKAILEHQLKDVANSEFFREVVIDRIENTINTMTFSKAEAQGPRKTMEDASFVIEIDQGVLAGVFDGHGGSEIANYVNEEIQKRFSLKLKSCLGDVHLTFSELFNELQQEIKKENDWFFFGSTAVISFIHLKKRKIYTATLGDSEGCLYRKIDGKMYCQPLSPLRDYSNKRDFGRVLPFLNRSTRLVNYNNNSENVKQYSLSLSKGNSKYLRFTKRLRKPSDQKIMEFSANLSRSFGDLWTEGAISQKPKITVAKIVPGTVVVLACDGLYDYVPQNRICALINENGHSENLAQVIVNEAFWKTEDNVSVVTIKVD